MIKIAIIKENPIHYNENDIKMNNFSYDNVESLMEDHIIFTTIDGNDGLIDELQKISKTNILMHTGIVSHQNDILYQICHLSILDQNELNSENTKNLKKNGISNYLTDEITPVYGDSLLIKINSKDDNYTLIDITLHDVIVEFKKKFVRNGIMLSVNGDINEYQYMFNPIDKIPHAEIAKYKYEEIEILGYVLMIFYNTEAMDHNKIGSQFAINTMRGNLHIGLREPCELDVYNQFSYRELTKSVFDELIELFCIHNDKRDLYHYEITHVKNEKRYYRNFYDIIKQRLSKYQILSINYIV